MNSNPLELLRKSSLYPWYSYVYWCKMPRLILWSVAICFTQPSHGVFCRKVASESLQCFNQKLQCGVGPRSGVCWFQNFLNPMISIYHYTYINIYIYIYIYHKHPKVIWCYIPNKPESDWNNTHRFPSPLLRFLQNGHELQRALDIFSEVPGVRGAGFHQTLEVRRRRTPPVMTSDTWWLIPRIVGPT